MYPVDDNEFRDLTVTKAVDAGSVTLSDGWSFWIPTDQPLRAKAGDSIRIYGAGLGMPVRGCFLNGEQVFYRTEAEDLRYRQEQMYGKDPQEWLARWDAGRSVWSVEMGGLGPGYEQVIQIAGAEVLRHLIELKWDFETPEAEYRTAFERDITQWSYTSPAISRLGLSGAQWGAAVGLAMRLYRVGPVGALGDPDIQARLIQVSKNFPQG